MLDKKNQDKINSAIKDITDILADWNLIELSDKAWIKFFDCRKALIILSRDEEVEAG